MRRREFITLVGGAAAAWPLTSRAQQLSKVPRVGYLWHTAKAVDDEPYFTAVIEGFKRLGYVDGRNIILEHRFPNELPERFRAMAAELVSLKCDVLMGGAVSSSYLKDATTTIPIVFMNLPDPIGLKLINSFARPGTNVTGLTNFGRDLVGKRLQLLKELVPGLSRVALLVNPDQQTTSIYVQETPAAAAELKLTVQVFEARSIKELDAAFEAMAAADIQAMINSSGGTAFQWRRKIAEEAIRHRIAFSAFSKETFEPGALMSYGADQVEMCRRSAVFVDKLLKGAKPAELPVEQPTKVEFFINLKTAKTLGLDVPLQLQQLADAVIE